jgi:hypothetical protein
MADFTVTIRRTHFRGVSAFSCTELIGHYPLGRISACRPFEPRPVVFPFSKLERPTRFPALALPPFDLVNQRLSQLYLR